MKKLTLWPAIGAIGLIMINPSNIHAFESCFSNADCPTEYSCVNGACCEIDVIQTDSSMCPNGGPGGGSGSCSGCSNCTDITWANYSTGYQRYTHKTCDCDTCDSSYSYRCAANYYGTSSNGTTGCFSCPNDGLSNAGTTSITGCYLPSGKTGSNSSGTYTYTSNCNYSN